MVQNEENLRLEEQKLKHLDSYLSLSWLYKRQTFYPLQVSTNILISLNIQSLNAENVRGIGNLSSALARLRDRRVPWPLTFDTVLLARAIMDPRSWRGSLSLPSVEARVSVFQRILVIRQQKNISEKTRESQGPR